MKKTLQTLFFLFIIQIGFSQNPRIRVNYFVQDGKMISSLGVNGGACIENLLPFTTVTSTTNFLEIRIHSIMRSSTGPTAATLNSCTGATASGAAGVPGWSCENRCESSTNAGRCDVWVPNGSQNASFPGNPNYTDTSAYPCSDILSYRLKGFESDATSSANLRDQNLNDGACGGTCILSSCFGNQQNPTSGDNNVLIDIGSISNATAPFCGSIWSTLYQSNYEGSACNTDGFTNYYYSRWKYRWCWDATTVLDMHAGRIKEPTITEYCSGATVAVLDSIQGFEAVRSFSEYQWQKNSGSGWSDISSASAKDLATTSLTNSTLNPITYQLRRATLFCTDFLATPTKTRVYSNITTVKVFPQAISPTKIAQNPAGSSVPIGDIVQVTTNNGTGGDLDANDEYRISSDNGVNWNSYNTEDNATVPSGATKMIVQGRRISGATLGCSNTAWSELASWIVDAVLPVELISFVASTNESTNHVAWSTASEYNTKEFLVEKSTDGSNWNTIGNVASLGNSNSIRTYNYIDINLTTGIAYYRLKIIDNDNSFEYSNIIYVNNVSVSASAKLISLYPNPTTGIINIVLKSNIENYSYIQINDILGKAIKQIEINKNNLSNTIQINCTDLAQGSYYVTIFDSYGLVNTIKFVKY